MYQKKHLDIILKHKVLNADSSQPLKMTAFSRHGTYKKEKFMKNKKSIQVSPYALADVIEALTNELNELKKNKPQQKKEEISQLSFNKEDDIAITPKSTISISEDKMRLLTSFQAHLDKLRAKSEL